MKNLGEFVGRSLIAGLLIVVPIYLAILLLVKAMQSVAGLARPFAMLLPESLPAEHVLSLLLVLIICFLVGAAIRTAVGQAIREKTERVLFERMPGYTLIRSLTQRLAGRDEEHTWKPALIETGDGLVPGFIIEEHDDGRLTVFVPSVPTPLAGAVLILERNRVHPLDVPFTQAVRTVSQWGSGAKALVAAMKDRDPIASGSRPS